MFSLIKKNIDRSFKIDFWDIFISRTNFNEFIKTKGKSLSNRILKIKSKKNEFFADPFIVSNKSNKVSIAIEDFSFIDGAKISEINYNKKNNTYKKKILLKGKHFSYPFIMKDNSKIYFLPEMSEEKQNLIFFKSKKFLKPIKNYLYGDKVIDPTIVKYKKIYWLFCSLKGHLENKNLYLYYSDDLLDNWIAHPKNPVIKNKNSARPAGSIIKHNNNLYRPSQDSAEGYGSQLYINLIKKLSKTEYSEVKLFNIKPYHKNYNGIHHISYKNNYFVFDQKYTVFSFYKIFYYFLKKFYFKYFRI